MRRPALGLFLLPLLLSLALPPLPAPAQTGGEAEPVWIQIEAQPARAEAEARARAYAGLFPDVAGFALRSGWYAIALGPAEEAAARERLRALKADRMIPADSFVVRQGGLGARVWPPEADAAAPDGNTGAATAAAVGPAAAGPTTDDAAATATGITELSAPAEAAETPAEAAAAEAALTRAEREAVQSALQWFGHYEAAIDGDFGRGSRAAMAAWQEANAAEPTGVLTTAERRDLLDRHRAAIAALGLAPLREAEAGIAIDLPLALVRFARYEPPFAVFDPVDGSGVRVLLISQPGDQASLAALYEQLQRLPVMPPEGPRSLGDAGFTLSGSDGVIESHAQVQLAGGLIKGWLLVWPQARGEGPGRVRAAMDQSFRAVGDRALDPGLVPLAASSRDGLLTGLQPDRPRLSRSGFYVDAEGRVLTTAEVPAIGCARITIDGGAEMAVGFADPAAGLLLLTPRDPLAPPGYARFQTAPEPVGAEVAVAGYSYGDALPAPALTFGRVAAQTGLDGETGLKRLDLPALPGDAGGPVVDGTGAVVGMLLPARNGTARHLPEGVAFAAAAGPIQMRLARAGLAPAAAAAGGALPPEDLARRARGMTVLVSCWD